MKNLLLVFAALAALSSCSSDDNAAPAVIVPDVDITGTWKEVAWQPPGDVWNPYVCEEFGFAYLYNFTDEGIVIGENYCNYQIMAPTTYTVQGDVLTLTIYGEQYYYKVSSEDEDTLYMQQFHYADNGPGLYHYKRKLERRE